MRKPEPYSGHFPEELGRLIDEAYERMLLSQYYQKHRRAGQQDRITMTTLGEERVRIGFNPTGNQTVEVIKTRTAALIDLCEELREDASDEAQRLLSLAQTHYEDAAMWAVKAATAEPKRGTEP